MPQHKVAKSDEVNSEGFKVVEVEGEKIALIRHDGAVKAIQDACPHQGGPLSEGSLKDGKVICPWHRWSFDLDTGACDLVPTACAKAYEVEESDGEVRIVFPETDSDEASEESPSIDIELLEAAQETTRNLAAAFESQLQGQLTALDAKTRALVRLGVQAVIRGHFTEAARIDAARQAGASEDELKETLALASLEQALSQLDLP